QARVLVPLQIQLQQIELVELEAIDRHAGEILWLAPRLSVRVSCPSDCSWRHGKLAHLVAECCPVKVEGSIRPPLRPVHLSILFQASKNVWYRFEGDNPLEIASQMNSPNADACPAIYSYVQPATASLHDLLDIIVLVAGQPVDEWAFEPTSLNLVWAPYAVYVLHVTSSAAMYLGTSGNGTFCPESAFVLSSQNLIMPLWIK